MEFSVFFSVGTLFINVGLIWPWLIFLFIYVRWVRRKEVWPFYSRK